MPKGQSDLNWSNIGRDDINEQGQIVWDAFFAAKADLERLLGDIAKDKGAAQEGDEFRFSYARLGQGTVGMAIDVAKKAQQSSGFGGLQRPKKQENLADWARDRDARGYRR